MDRRPPGSSICTGESIQPWRMAATAAAQAPVPQAWVSPAPRSPYAQPRMAAINHLQEADVDPLRKARVMLDLRPQFMHRRTLDTVHPQHRMGLPMDTAANSTCCPSTSSE